MLVTYISEDDKDSSNTEVIYIILEVNHGFKNTPKIFICICISQAQNAYNGINYYLAWFIIKINDKVWFYFWPKINFFPKTMEWWIFLYCIKCVCQLQWFVPHKWWVGVQLFLTAFKCGYYYLAVGQLAQLALLHVLWGITTYHIEWHTAQCFCYYIRLTFTKACESIKLYLIRSELTGITYLCGKMFLAGLKCFLWFWSFHIALPLSQFIILPWVFLYAGGYTSLSVCPSVGLLYFPVCLQHVW